MSHDDYEVEPIPGLPAMPPRDETILWQGSPHWPTLARRLMHIDWVAGYFAVLIVWRTASGIASGLTPTELLTAALPAFLLAGTAFGILTLLAWGMARTTIYTITSHRIVMRFGIALPVTFNLPFATFSKVAVRKLSDGYGEIAVDLSGGQRIAYFVLWPHVRPWRLKSPQPMLRATADIENVSQILAKAIKAHGAMRAIATSIPAQAKANEGGGHIHQKYPALEAAE